MRSIFIAMLLAAGVGLVGTAGTVSAAPISGVGINEVINGDSNVTQVQHWRWGSRRRGGHWRYGSRGYRCHVRRWSRYGRC